jgi:hypothetical protein
MQAGPMQQGIPVPAAGIPPNLQGPGQAGGPPPQFNAMWAAWNAQAAGTWPPAGPHASLPPGALTGQANHMLPVPFAGLAAPSQSATSPASSLGNNPLALNGIPMNGLNGVSPINTVPLQVPPPTGQAPDASQFGSH